MTPQIVLNLKLSCSNAQWQKKRKSDQPFAEKHLKEYSGINASYAQSTAFVTCQLTPQKKMSTCPVSLKKRKILGCKFKIMEEKRANQ